MSSLSEIMKKIKEAKNLEVREGEVKRTRITFKNRMIHVVVETVPDLDALSLDQLYELQEKYEERLDALSDEEPDEEQDPEAYKTWEEAYNLLEQDLDEVTDKIDEVTEEIEEAEEEEDY